MFVTKKQYQKKIDELEVRIFRLEHPPIQKGKKVDWVTYAVKSKGVVIDSTPRKHTFCDIVYYEWEYDVISNNTIYKVRERDIFKVSK